MDRTAMPRVADRHAIVYLDLGPTAAMCSNIEQPSSRMGWRHSHTYTCTHRGVWAHTHTHTRTYSHNPNTHTSTPHAHMHTYAHAKKEQARKEQTNQWPGSSPAFRSPWADRAGAHVRHLPTKRIPDSGCLAEHVFRNPHALPQSPPLANEELLLSDKAH